jgi:hypothetical protein
MTEQIILFGGRPWPTRADDQICISAQYATLCCVRHKLVGAHAHRNACLAVQTAWPISNVLAATKSDATKRLVQFVGMIAIKFGKNLTFGFARQIRAWARAGNKKSRKTDWCAHILSASLPRPLRYCLPFMHICADAGKRIYHL